jgi:phospholipid-binding lipoprotein MlaA
VAKGYNSVFPEPVRISVRNFFFNLAMPVRFVNSFLQGELESAGIELARFGINTTIGFAGLFDVAKNSLHLESRERDTGLTLGHYGIGPGPYIIWPFLGPSSLRDTVGMVGDGFLTPVNYITPWEDALALEAYEYFNDNALRLGEYEDLIESAVEPYIALRNAYSQHRKSLIKQ